MPTRTDLTSADLDEIRESALGAANALGVAAELAEAADTGRLADPDDAGYALALAAEIAESRNKIDAAQRYVERALEAYGKREDGKSGAAHALHARILFRSGRADEALAELDPLRPLLTQHADAPAYISAALAAGGKTRVAEEWLTAAVETALAERTGEPADADEAGVLFFLLQQRHRVRHALGRSHDNHDNLADRLETRLANAAPRPASDLLFWPQDEFAKVLLQWPALADAYGKDWDEHRARLERELVRLTGAGRTGLELLRGTVAGLTSFAAGDADLTSAKTQNGYAQLLASGPGHVPWPPERNGTCWCGSGLKYKKCCLPRSRS